MPVQGTGIIAGSVNVSAADFSFDNSTTGAFNFIKFTGTETQITFDNCGFQPQVLFIVIDGTEGLAVCDENLGVEKFFDMDIVGAAITDANSIISFDSDGFTLGSSSAVNSLGDDIYIMACQDVSGVFSHFTYSGTGSAKNEAHGLGATADCTIIRGDATGREHNMFHKDMNGGTTPEEFTKSMAGFAAPIQGIAFWDNTAPDATNIRVGTSADINASGQSFYGYVFADDGSSGGQCGILPYTGNGSTTGPTITFGWAAEWFWMTTAESNGQERWYLWPKEFAGSNPRSGRKTTNDNLVFGSDDIDFNATTVQIKTADSIINTNNIDYLCLAFRRT